jgi:hypothetical protein
MTAMRAGLAAALLIYSVRHIVDQKMWRWTASVLFASLFHLSALIVFPFYFLARIKLTFPKFLLIVATVWAVVNLFGLSSIMDFFTFIPKVAEYRDLMLNKNLYATINVWNVIYVTRWFTFLLIFAFYVRRPDLFNDYEVVSLQLFLFALLVFYGLSTFPVIGSRLYELIGIFQIVLYPVILKFFKRRFVGVSVLGLVVLLQFYALVFHSKLADFFYPWGQPYNLFPSNINL